MKTNPFNRKTGKVITLKQSDKVMASTKLGDIREINNSYYEVIEWYYFYITLKKRSKIYIMIKEMRESLGL